MTAAVAFPAFCAEALKDALLLCADTLIPALFLYITAANLLSLCGAFAPFSKTSAGRAFRRLTGLSDAGAAAFAVGTVSGFPSGALFLARMKNAGGIGEDEAARLMPFVNNASPAFVVGAVGSLFGSPAFGTALFAAQCVASFSGILIEKAVFGKAENACRSLAGEDFYSAFPRAVRESVFSMLAVCGFVALFSVPCRALESAGRAGAFLSSA
ncbi:MAG: hypothetical protein J5940_06395, partial [Clostridia bacterium]|nr:hypothetical protein [Clostridia bacterium]